MKAFSVIAILLTSNLLFAQEKLMDVLPMQDGKVVYTAVTNADSTTKDVLYSNAKQWFAETYKSAQDVIQLDDKDAGTVIGKGLFKSGFTVFMDALQVNVHHTVKIYVKDNKYKYEITDFIIDFHVAASKYNSASDYEGTLEDFVKGRNKNNMRKMCTDIDTQVQSMIASLQKEMKSNANKDW
jgi:hypothetical protein